jgi:predicted dehydrogenase
MISKPWRVGIIGLGKIAVGYDRPNDDKIQTHLKACIADHRIQVAVVSEIDQIRVEQVRRDWNLQAKAVPARDFFDEDLDVICIATPDDTHLEFLEACAANPPSVVLCEKPLGRDLLRAEQAIASLNDRGCRVAVNYLRRWIPNLDLWMAKARSGAWGMPLSVTSYYTKGFWHNGVHAIDLVEGFIGCQAVEALTWGEAHDDFGPEDPTLSVLVTLAQSGWKVPFWLRGMDGRQQTVFSIDILFEKARVVIEDHEVVQARLMRPAALDDASYAPELRVVETFRDEPPHLMAEVWKNLVDNLENDVPLKSTGASALEILRLQTEIVQLCESHNPNLFGSGHG